VSHLLVGRPWSDERALSSREGRRKENTKCVSEGGRTLRMRTDAGRGGRRNGDLMNATGGDYRLVDRVRAVRIAYTVI
jgi:hypothetical protein